MDNPDISIDDMLQICVKNPHCLNLINKPVPISFYEQWALRTGLYYMLPKVIRRKFPVEIREKLALQQPQNIPIIPCITSCRYMPSYAYISDIHLDNKIAGEPPQLAAAKVKEIAENIATSIDPITSMLLIAGDTSNNFSVYKHFFTCLHEAAPLLKVYTVLGNHELWDDIFCNLSIAEIANRYRDFLTSLGYLLLENQLLVDSPYFPRPIILSDNTIAACPTDDLKYILDHSSKVILGGMGGTGYNTEFNAANGVYGSALTSLALDKTRSDYFRGLYEKIASAMPENKSAILLSHMPMADWGATAKTNWTYVSGHTHHNYSKQGNPAIYADNQVGYKKTLAASAKIFTLAVDKKDTLAHYPDGIHTISLNEYRRFLWNKHIEFSSYDLQQNGGEIKVIKKDGYYMFTIIRNSRLYWLEGGRTHRLKHSLDDWYSELGAYIADYKKYFSKVHNYLKSLALSIRQLGGTGNLHGNIVDIDFYHHIMLHRDGSLEYYYADTMGSHQSYASLAELVNAPTFTSLTTNTMTKRVQQQGHIPALLELSKVATSEELTAVYSDSRKMRALQYFFEDNIFRIVPSQSTTNGSK